MSERNPLPRRSPRFFRGFRKYANHYIRKHFHAMRIDRGGPPPAPPDRPVIVVLNHASWWDPLVALSLTETFPRDRVHYAPIDALGLEQYRILEWVGFFGVEPGTTRGSLAFLRRAGAILDRPKSVLWITAQGGFTDVRERPTRFKEGLGHLLHRAPQVALVPLAIEYPFWNDRLPESLARFGPPIPIDHGATRSPNEWTRIAEEALEETQDQLAETARARDPAAFDAWIKGAAGVGGFYDLGRRMMARIRGEAFSAEHRA